MLEMDALSRHADERRVMWNAFSVTRYKEIQRERPMLQSSSIAHIVATEFTRLESTLRCGFIPSDTGASNAVGRVARRWMEKARLAREIT